VDKERLIYRLSSVDWDFGGYYSESPFSSIHWHPCRYASQVPATLIGLLSNAGDTVLDPFVGSGITAVEAQRLGRKSIGIDINPVACLISEAKTVDADIDVIVGNLSRIAIDAQSLLSDQLTTQFQAKHSLAPPTVQADKWYMPQVGQDLSLLWSLINSYDGNLKLLASAAFSAILLAVCRETRHWGYVCDNSTPRGVHSSDVLSEYLKVIGKFRAAYQRRHEERSEVGGRIPSAQIVQGEAVQQLQQFTNSSVDVVITSPPYYGVCDYVKAQRLSLEWMGVEIEPLRLNETGARSKRHRKLAYDEYLRDLEGLLLEVFRVVRPKAYAALVIGESERRQPVLSDLLQCATKVGFELVLDIERRVSAQRRQTPSIKVEHLLILGANK
jgi:DNA modification methylase